MNDLNVVHAASLAQVHDSGEIRRGPAQADLDIVTDGAVAIRKGRIVAVGATAEVLAAHGNDDVPTIDARGRCVLPGLVECHSHPLFAGERHHEYAERLGGASLAEVAARGGGIWSSVVATRGATDDELLALLSTRMRRIVEGGVTTLEVKSGYGLTVDEELRGLELLQRARTMTPMQLAITFLGAHVVPRDLDGDAEVRAARYTNLIGGEMLSAVVAQGIAEFQDVTVEQGYFTPDQGLQLMRRSHDSGLPVRAHADAWASSQGWRTAVEGGAVSAEHLTYTPDDEIIDVGRTDTIAVILPMAELVYMTSRRANARLFIETGVPVAIATDFCSSIRATSLLTTLAVAAPWFRMTPGEVIVGATLNGAYSLGRQSACGSLDVGKRGDLIILDCAHPDEVCLAVGAPLLDQVVIAGRVVLGEQGMIRVVSGEFGGRKLVVPDGLSTRPTTDKVRQAVFNSLDSAGLIDGAAVADLFAGSGALGIEALSRGAESCVFVERDRAALQALRANIDALGLKQRTTVVTSDVPAWVPALRCIDLALIDPPYEFDGWDLLLAVLQVPYVVAEAGHEIEPPTGWEALKSRRYGRTWVTQLQRVA